MTEVENALVGKGVKGYCERKAIVGRGECEIEVTI